MGWKYSFGADTIVLPRREKSAALLNALDTAEAQIKPRDGGSKWILGTGDCRG